MNAFNVFNSPPRAVRRKRQTNTEWVRVPTKDFTNTQATKSQATMSQTPIRYLNANEAFVRAAFHSQGKISKALADYATWTVTGVAAIIGALLVNSESVTKAVEPHMLK